MSAQLLNLARGTYQGAGVGGVRRIVLQVAREAKVRHFAHQVAVDQDVPGSQISVHVIHLRKVLHPSSNSSEHPHQLDHCELPVILLQQERAGTGVRVQTPPQDQSRSPPTLGGHCTFQVDCPDALPCLMTAEVCQHQNTHVSGVYSSLQPPPELRKQGFTGQDAKTLFPNQRLIWLGKTFKIIESISTTIESQQPTQPPLALPAGTSPGPRSP